MMFNEVDKDMKLMYDNTRTFRRDEWEPMELDKVKDKLMMKFNKLMVNDDYLTALDTLVLFKIVCEKLRLRLEEEVTV